eukprot:scaffold633_cov288-Ochromonas_danica.AAC.20
MADATATTTAKTSNRKVKIHRSTLSEETTTSIISYLNEALDKSTIEKVIHYPPPPPPAAAAAAILPLRLELIEQELRLLHHSRYQVCALPTSRPAARVDLQIPRVVTHPPPPSPPPL